MKELDANQQILLFLLTSVGLITLPHVNHIPVSSIILFYALLVWRFLAIWKPHYLPGKFIVFIITVAAIVIVYYQHKGLLGRNGGTSLFVTALGLKLLETRKQRDIYIVNYLAFVVASTQFLFQQSIFMAAYIVFVSIVLLATLVTINSCRTDTLASLKTAGTVIAQAIPLAIILFIVFPRIEAPRWLLFDQENQATIGLTDSMEPGAISRLGMSDELVFRVKFAAEIPSPSQRYWRGPVLSYTDGKRWEESQNLKYKQELEKIQFSGLAYEYTLMMEPQEKNWVFALDMASSFPQNLNQNALYQLINNGRPFKRAEYLITSHTEFNTGKISQTELTDNLQLPAPASEKIKNLVTKLQAKGLSSEAYIQALLNYFRNQAFFYTLTPPLMGDKPIENFLFNQRYGFCSHYATAFVYLMRVADIPARVVTGYQGGSINKVGGFMEIRQANAHAWAEVWLKDKGWTRYDPTAAIAPERIEQDVNIDLQIATGLINFSQLNKNTGKALSWLRQTRQLWRSMDYNWQRWVINYSQKSRSDFLSALGITNLKSVFYSLLISISVITLFWGWFILKNKRLRVDKELLLYQRFCHKTAKAGLNKMSGETARHFAQRAVQRWPEQAATINQITALFVLIRYQGDSEKKDLSLLKKQILKFKI